jgi:hypothetical protein
MLGFGEKKRSTQDLRQFVAIFRVEYQKNRFIQVWRVMDAKTVGFATLFAMEWAKQENADLQDVIQISETTS